MKKLIKIYKHPMFLMLLGMLIAYASLILVSYNQKIALIQFLIGLSIMIYGIFKMISDE
jgi:hypothetical protein